MSIEPKKGGKCWSCRYCEDIATQDDNPSGSYYRKCTKSGREYIDTCRFSCSDYIWDGEHSENSTASSTSDAEEGGCFSKLLGCFSTLLIIGLINAAVGGIIWFIFSVLLGK